MSATKSSNIDWTHPLYVISEGILKAVFVAFELRKLDTGSFSSVTLNFPYKALFKKFC